MVHPRPLGTSPDNPDGLPYDLPPSSYAGLRGWRDALRRNVDNFASKVASTFPCFIRLKKGKKPKTPRSELNEGISKKTCGRPRKATGQNRRCPQGLPNRQLPDKASLCIDSGSGALEQIGNSIAMDAKLGCDGLLVHSSSL